MLKQVLLIAATVGFSGAAFAHPPYWAPAHGHRGYYAAARPVYVAPAPVYVVPAPRVVYAPAPVLYPAPVVYPAPVYPAPFYGATPSISIRLNLPL